LIKNRRKTIVKENIMTVKQFVFGFTLLASIFASGALMLSCDSGGGTVDDNDSLNGAPGLVVAVWGRYLTETTANLLKEDFLAYCGSEGIAHGNITFRYKSGASGESFYEVAAFGQAVLDEGDVNIVLPVGTNIGTTGKLTLLAGGDRKKLLEAVGDAGSVSATRYIGYLTDDELTGKFYNYVDMDRAKAILAVNRTAP
jgi:hypothetical protein